jgi:hemoglobin
MEISDYERVGGEEAIGRLMARFVDRMFADPIIGFLFQGKDRDRIVKAEGQLSGIHLGSGGRYEGRGIISTHRPLKINKGQFRRRLHLLEKTLREGGVPEDVVERWLAHDRRLENTITDGTDCVLEPY